LIQLRFTRFAIQYRKNSLSFWGNFHQSLPLEHEPESLLLELSDAPQLSGALDGLCQSPDAPPPSNVPPPLIILDWSAGEQFSRASLPPLKR
jgi:hypothetical protein